MKYGNIGCQYYTNGRNSVKLVQTCEYQAVEKAHMQLGNCYITTKKDRKRMKYNKDHIKVLEFLYKSESKLKNRPVYKIKKIVPAFDETRNIKYWKCYNEADGTKWVKILAAGEKYYKEFKDDRKYVVTTMLIIVGIILTIISIIIA